MLRCYASALQSAMCQRFRWRLTTVAARKLSLGNASPPKKLLRGSSLSHDTILRQVGGPCVMRLDQPPTPTGREDRLACSCRPTTVRPRRRRRSGRGGNSHSKRKSGSFASSRTPFLLDKKIKNNANCSQMGFRPNWRCFSVQRTNLSYGNILAYNQIHVNSQVMVLTSDQGTLNLCSIACRFR